MQHLFQSAFLQALGYAIAHSVWQTAIVWLFYISIGGSVSMSAAARYRMGVTAQVIGFIWFLFTFQFYYQQYNQAWQPSTVASQQLQPVLTSGSGYLSGIIQWMLKGEMLLPYISMAYLLLMVFLSVRWLLGYRQTQRIRHQGLQKMPAEWRLFVQRIAAQLNIKKTVRVFLSEQVSTPLTIGFLKPIILVPVASINHLSTEQMEAVLLHELAHIKRYDYLVNILLSVAEISLFFNPFTQLLSKHIRKERENCCDDWVLQFKYEAPVYAEALLRIAYLQQAPALAMTATGKKKDLLYRVKRMIERKENRFSYRKQLLAFFLVTGILSSVAWLSPLKTNRSEKQPIAVKASASPKQPLHPYTVEPMAMSVKNPLFNPVFFLSKPLQEEMKKNIATAEKEIKQVAELQPDALMTSITPLVTNALKQASLEMELQRPNWEKEIAQMEKAKLELTRTLSADSAFLPVKLRSQFKQEINTNLSKMSADIQKAKAEMQKAFQESKNFNTNLDKEKLRHDIDQAMEVVFQLDKDGGLSKLVLQSLNSVAPLIKEENRQTGRNKTRRVTTIAKTEKKEITPPEPPVTVTIDEKELPVPDFNLNAEEIILPDASTVISHIELERLRAELMRMASMIQMKITLAKDTEAKKLRLIPLVHKKRIREEEKRVILFQ